MLQAQEKYPDFSREVYYEGADSLLYRLMVPTDYQENKKYPLVIFFHGAGERGTDNERTLTHFAHFLTSPDAKNNYPCFVLVPQCPEKVRWVEVDWGAQAHTQPAQPSKPLAMSLSVIEALKNKFSIDTNRLYVTGLSMGGYATWDIITRYPDKFAAAVPVCGGGDENTAPKIVNLPIWAFHGDKDGVVLPSRSRNMIAALKKAGASPRYTEYKGVGHDSWKPAYKEPDLLKWIFSQEKK